jgi:hypothetical protein
MARRNLAAGGALLAVLAAPAAAQAAPTIQPLKPCYVTAQSGDEPPQREGVQVAAAGFTPNSNVRLTIDGAPVPGGEALKAGQYGELYIPADNLPAPFVESGHRPFTLTLAEIDNPANSVSATAESAALGVSYEPASARPSQRVRFKALGFTKRKPIYAHYVYKGKPRRTVRMARKPRTCGGLRTHRRLFPIKTPRLGRWTVQFDQSRKYVDPDEKPITFAEREILVMLEPR